MPKRLRLPADTNTYLSGVTTNIRNGEKTNSSSLFADAGRIFRMGSPVVHPGSTLPYELITEDWVAKNF